MTKTKIDWQKYDGLVTAVVQDFDTARVLMVGSMNEEALEKTVTSGQVTFFSRSKQRLWAKGETSGNFLTLVDYAVDCDGDALLILARPQGPTCHQNTESCFGESSRPELGFLNSLTEIIDQRFRERPDGSYTTQLLAEGLDRIIQKVGEEAIEVVIAAKNSEPDVLRAESADFIFHWLVLLREKGIELSSVVKLLERRHQKTSNVLGPVITDAPS